MGRHFAIGLQSMLLNMFEIAPCVLVWIKVHHKPWKFLCLRSISGILLTIAYQCSSADLSGIANAASFSEYFTSILSLGKNCILFPIEQQT